MGFSLVKTETVSIQNRGRAAATFSKNQTTPFEPSRGDLILSNFSSWIDVLYAAIKFNPVFALPVVAPPSKSIASAASAASQAKASPARRRNAGASVVTDVNNAAAAATDSSSSPPEKRLLGFKLVSMWQAIGYAGHPPLIYGRDAHKYRDLSQLVKDSPGPIMLYPELVTSNNRGLLKMANPLFPASWRDLYRVTGSLRMGKGQAQFFLMTIKHDPPSKLAATSSVCSIPSSPPALHPLPHLWSILCSLSFARGLQVRLLDPNESPTSASYKADASAGQPGRGEDALAEAVGGLLSSLSRLRRTGLGWEDKELFLEMYRRR